MEFLYTLPLMVKAVILGIVEGLTEFLPISSTGHLILAGSLLGWNDDKAQVFDIAIQTGAILAVIWYYRVRIGKVLAGLFTDRVQPTQRQAQRFAAHVLIGFAPAALLGLLAGKAIKAHLFGPVPVAIALVVGGFIIFWVEKRQESIKPRVTDIDSLTALDALKLGLAQCCALIPGTSRSGSTIIGGMLFGLSRQVATEFSFYLAIPTLIGASVYDTWKHRDLLGADDISLFLVGSVVAFFSALACVHWLIRFVASNSFRLFAWYRVVFGLVILATAYTGVINWHNAG